LFLLVALSATPVKPARATAAASSRPEVTRAYAGMYLSDVSGFDLREGRFQADLDVWLKWSGQPEPPVLRFVNGEIATREEQERESDGDWHSVRWRVQGTFRGTFPLHTFPFDRQQLRIELATAEDTAHLAPDLGSSGMARQFSITGWEYQPFFRTEVGREVLASDLGSIRNEGHGRQLESVTFIVDLQRPATSNVIKFMLPLAIILAMAFLVFAIPAQELEVRAAMGVTALLSVVAFHFAMAGSLPDVPYLVAADRLFLASYVLVLLSVLETVIGYRLGGGRAGLSRTLDRAGAAILSLAAVVVGASVATMPARLEAARGADQAAPPAAPAPAPAASARDELRVAVPNLSSLTSHGMGQLLRRGLTQPGADGELRPHLAEAIPSMTDESVRLLPDGGMLVRWRLRPRLRWSDGAPLTARDLVYSLALIQDPDRAEVTQVDERTIQIRYRRRLSQALTDFPLYPEHAARPVFDGGGMDALRQRNQSGPLPGDGPYRVASFTAGAEAVFERNPHFAGPPPAIRTLRVRVVAGEDLAEAMRRGEVDLVPSLPTSLVESVRALPEAAVHSALDETLLMLHPDLEVPALASAEVRRMLLKALDRNAIASAYVGGAGRVARTFRPDQAADFAADAAATPHAPEEARRYFQQNAIPPLKLMAAESPRGSGSAAALELVHRQLTAAGLTLEVEAVPSSKAFDAFQRGHHGGLLLHARRGDQRLARYFNLPAGPGGVVDAITPRPHFPAALIDLNRLFETSLFPERRRLLSMRMQRAFAEILPVLPLAFATQVTGLSRELRGFGPGQSGSLWWNVETWTLGRPAPGG
jgi:peptide/nickel transport system substrate-binding protein